MKDVEKVNIERENSVKRLRRRKRSMGIYGLLVITAVLGLGITLSCTLLFNLNEVTFLGANQCIYYLSFHKYNQLKVMFT